MRLDTSITNINDFVFGKKNAPLQLNTQLKKAGDILSQEMVIQEKIDGTKLTLVRTDKISQDFWENWAVAYKGDVLYYQEFVDLSEESVKDSIGISQYWLVFEHLKNINQNILRIPRSTEFSVEFAQNKDTLTRTYDSTGGLFLRTYAQTRYYIHDGKLVSVSIDEETSYLEIERMAKLLGMYSFPIWANGKMDCRSSVLQSVSDNNFLKLILSENINWNDPIQIIKHLSTCVLSMNSVIGGPPEGAVLTLQDGRQFKVVQPDQYDKTVRAEKKQQYKSDYETENEYFKQIRKSIYPYLEYCRGDSVTCLINTIGRDRHLFISEDNEYRIIHPKKNYTQIWDDIHETARLMLYKRELLGENNQSVALLPIAGKPFHLGHWKIIHLASQQNDRVVVYLSVKDRERSKEFPISGKDSVVIWNEFYHNLLPNNVKVKFVDSPLQEVFYELSWINQVLTQDNVKPFIVQLYSDLTDIHSNFPRERLIKYAPDISHLIKRTGISRNITVPISGTEMRKFLEEGNFYKFSQFLPPIELDNKIKVWKILKK